MVTFSIVNQKGGVGKTSTALALASELKNRKYKVLAVDLDSQTNFTYTAKGTTDDETVVDVLMGNCPARDAIQETDFGDLIPADSQLSGAELFLKDTGKEYKLKEAISDLSDNYEFAVIDAPPSLGVLTLNALTASDYVIVPAQADIYSLQGIGQLNGTLETVRKYTNPDLKTAGILLTRFNARTVLANSVAEMAKEMAKALHTKVFKTRIREAVAVREAQISQKSLQEYAPKAKVTADYISFVNELLKEVKKNV